MICFKCKKIYDLKISQFEKINHEHYLFKHFVWGFGDEEEDDDYGISKHFYKQKDLDYLIKKIKEEKIYFKALNKLLSKYKIKDKYTSYLQQMEAEINTFEFYYNYYISKDHRNYRRFKNLSNIFNHKILLFKLKEDEVDIKQKLRKEIEKINNKLNSIYVLNTFHKDEKILISNYEQHWIKTYNNISAAVGLSKSFFAFGGRSLDIYQKEINKDTDKGTDKYKVTLITEISNIPVSAMISLGKEKIVVGNYSGIYLIKFCDNYKKYNICKLASKRLTNVIKLNKNNFISFEEKKIYKWNLIKAENSIEIKCILRTEDNILNMCEINKIYFAYQSYMCIHIIYSNTFKERKRIKYDDFKIDINNFGSLYYDKRISAINGKIIGISNAQNKIDFYNIETGKKVAELISDSRIFSFLGSKRDKEENDIITICEYFSGRGGYGFCQDYSLKNNKLIKLSQTMGTWEYNLKQVFEIDNNTILVTGEKEIYFLLYPRKLEY